MRPLTTAVLLVTLAAVPRAVAQTATPEADGSVIRNVSIVDVERGLIETHRTVVIVGDRIERIELIGQTGATPADETVGMTEIDGTGLYLMPGLFDAHVHYSASPHTFGPMLIANGVTTVRDTGAPTAAIIALRASAAARGGPHMIATGAIVDGDPPVWPFSEVVTTPDEARAAVRRLADAGVDQIKVYERLLKDVHRAAVEEAHARGLKVTGHVPQATTLGEIVAVGQDCVEHLTGFARVIGEATGYEPPRPDGTWPWFGAWERLSRLDDDAFEAVLRPLGDKRMMHCPTLVVIKGMGRAPTDPDDPRLAYVPDSLRSFWDQPRGEFPRLARAALPHMQSLVGRLHRAGVPLMIGTDLANPYVYAGFSVHEEMQMFGKAGIPAADVLRAATIVPARFCGVDDDLGTIAPGKIASLVLVRANPLDDIAATAAIEGVFLRGRYRDRAALDGMLAEIRAIAASSAPPAAAVPGAEATPGEVLHRGRYTATFDQFDAAVEDFVISRIDDGYFIAASNTPRPGNPSAPFTLAIEVGADFTFRTATYERTGPDPITARYTNENGTIRAEAKSGDTTMPTELLEIPPDAIVTGPAFVADFITLGAARLDVGEIRTFPAVSFGVPTWQPSATPMTVRRHDDTTVALGGGAPRPARRYTSSISTPYGDYNGEAWVDPSGLLLKSVLTMPFGRFAVELTTEP